MMSFCLYLFIFIDRLFSIPNFIKFLVTYIFFVFVYKWADREVIKSPTAQSYYVFVPIEYILLERENA